MFSFWHVLVPCIGLSHFHLLPFKYFYGAKCLIYSNLCTFHVKENSARLQWYSCARYKAPGPLVLIFSIEIDRQRQHKWKEHTISHLGSKFYSNTWRNEEVMADFLHILVKMVPQLQHNSHSMSFFLIFSIEIDWNRQLKWKEYTIFHLGFKFY